VSLARTGAEGRDLAERASSPEPPDLREAMPKRVRHVGAWPLPAPRRAAPGTALRDLQDRMPRCEGGRAPVLSGDGTESALLIGQAPGWREIATGLPFAHDAGKRLAGWLALAGIGLEDFRERWYVTSVGKCYPGRRQGASVDSPPSRAEVLRWSPILDEEVRLVEPRLVVLVGGLAHRYAFGPRARLDDLVGSELRWDGAPAALTVALPHPSGASTWLNDAGRADRWRDALRIVSTRWQALAATVAAPGGGA
jgi:uracil-DNA glycosylase